MPWTMHPWTPPWCQPNFGGPVLPIWWGNLADQPTRSNQPGDYPVKPPQELNLMPMLSFPWPPPWCSSPAPTNKMMDVVSWIPWWLLSPGKPWTSKNNDEELNWYLSLMPYQISHIPEEIKEKIFTFVQKELEGRKLPDIKSDNEFLSYFGFAISEITQKLYNSKEGQDIINYMVDTPSFRIGPWGAAAAGAAAAVVIGCAAAYIAYKAGWLK